MAYNEKWQANFPTSVGNQTRPTDPIDDSLPLETNGFPQFISNDPVDYKLQNAFLQQLFSNDKQLQTLIAKIVTDYVKKSGDTMTGNLNMDDSQERRIIGFTNNIGIYWNPDNIGAFDWNVQKPGGIWSYNKQNKIMTVNAQGGVHVDVPITLQDVSLMKSLAVADDGETKIYGYNANVGISFNGSKNFDIYDWKSNNKILHYDGGEISLGADREGVNTRLLIPHASQLVISKSSNEVPTINFANNQDSQGSLAMSNGDFSTYRRTGTPGSFCAGDMYFMEKVASGSALVSLTADAKGVLNFWNPVDNKRGSLNALNANLDGILYAPALGHTLGSLTVAKDAIINGNLNVAGSITINGGSLMKSLAVADDGETKIYGYNANVGISFNGSKNFDIYDWKSNNKILHYDGGEISLGADREGVNTRLLIPHASQLVISKSSNEAPTINFTNNQDSQGALVFSQGTIAPYKKDGTRGAVQAQSVVYDDGTSQISLYIDAKWAALWNGTDNHRGDLKVRHLNCEGNLAVDGTFTGAGANGFAHRVAGCNTPVMTPLIDWNAMAAANGGTSCKNLVNAGTGVTAYGGDSSALNSGDIILSQSYQNFDAILVVYTDDSATTNHTVKFEKWEIDIALSIGYRFSLTKNPSQYWYIYPKAVNGTTTHNCSTTTRFYCNSQNCGIIEIYGLNY